MTNKILSATVGPMPRPMPLGLWDPMPSVTATFENGEVKELFSFYPDEIMFTPEEFVGLTEEQAHVARHKKDMAYIRFRSP